MVSNLQEKPVNEVQTGEPDGILLLPGHLFFVRTVELPAGLDAGELPSFAELSVEQSSPFTLNQLYYGYFHPENSGRLLVFAAYRKQLSVYEDEEWEGAELVLPEFAALLGFSRTKPTLAFLESDLEVTAVFWDGKNELPARIVSRRLESDDEELNGRMREELRRKIGAVPAGVEEIVYRNPRPRFDDKSLIFQLESDRGEEESRISRPVFLAMDIRDKEFLGKIRQIQRQNRYIWGAVMMLFAAFLTLAVFEGVLFAGDRLLQKREGAMNALQPEVEQIMRQEELARRLEELSGERLLPFEMLAHLNESRPRSVYFTRVRTDGLRSFQIEAATPRNQDVDRFQRVLEQDEALEQVEIRNLQHRARDGMSTFVLVGTFAEGALTDFSKAGSGGDSGEEKRIGSASGIPELPGRGGSERRRRSEREIPELPVGEPEPETEEGAEP